MHSLVKRVKFYMFIPHKSPINWLVSKKKQNFVASPMTRNSGPVDHHWNLKASTVAAVAGSGLVATLVAP